MMIIWRVMKTLYKMISVCLSQYLVVWLWALAVTLLGASLAFLFQPSSSRAQTISETLSETTTVESLGGGLELHTTETVTRETTIGDEETTNNYLLNPGFESNTGNNPANWTVEDGSVSVSNTCGVPNGCLRTGNQTTGGGTVSETVDLFDKMPQAEINVGFDINYGADVFSHPSTAFVPACDSTPGNGPDCRDSFSITLGIKDSAGTLLHEFEHVFNEITFTQYNNTDFKFSQTIPQNTHTSALATLELFGIDAGFPGGFFGPAFDNTFITATHTDIVIQQITTITEELVQIAIETISDEQIIEIDTEVEIETVALSEPEIEQTFEITISDNFGETIESFEVTVVDTEITIEPISVAEAPIEVTVEATVEEVQTQIAEISQEMEVENDISNTMEPAPDSESPGSTTETTTSETESGESTQSTEDQPNEESTSTEDTVENEEPTSSEETVENEEPTSSEETVDNEDPATEESSPEDEKSETKVAEKPTKNKQSSTKSKSKEEAKKEIATRVVTKIIQKLGQDAASQATQLALMNVIGANLTVNAPILQDRSDFFTDATLPDTQISDNNFAQYIMFGGSNVAHDALIETQYK